MPVYEYQCTNKKCKNVYEELAKFDDIVNCPKCGKSGEKLIATTYHPVFVHRKGKFSMRRNAVKTKKKPAK